MKFVLKCVPIPWKAPYVGTRGTFSPRHAIMEEYRSMLKAQYDGPILDEAFEVTFIFIMPIPKSASKKKRAQMISGEIRPTGTPDRTNMAKLYEDCLQGIIIKNDSKIVDGRVAKYYGEEPRIEIYLSTIKDLHNL